ncbi:hypothetical protein Tco_0900321 [Tanacetum coccineum]
MLQLVGFRYVYDLGVVTPRALVYAGLMTSGDARSWYMINGDVKSWVLSVLHIFTVILHSCEVNEHSLRIVVLRLIWTPAWAFGFIMSPRMTTQSAGRETAAPRGGRTGGQTGRGGGRTRVAEFTSHYCSLSRQPRGCTYKEFLACNPKEYDGKGGAIVYTYWIKKMESVQDMSWCRDNKKVKYTAGSFASKALTWWNS